MSFLNYAGSGEILIGLSDDGSVIGLDDCDSVQLKAEGFENLNGKINGNLNGKINSILEILKSNPTTTLADLVEITGKLKVLFQGS